MTDGKGSLEHQTAPLAQRERLFIAGRNLMVDAIAAEVAGSFDEARIPYLLLKGPAVSRWLYAEGERSYGDADLLIREGDVARAADELTRLGYTRSQVVLELVPHHAKTWVRPPSPYAVDLHTRIWGANASEGEQWSLLSRGSGRLVVAGYPVNVPSKPATMLHVVIHAVQHGPAVPAPLEDLERLLSREQDMDAWREVVDLAKAIDATAAFSAGLQATDSGKRLAEALGVLTAADTEALLRIEKGDSSPAIVFDQFIHERGARRRLSMLRRGMIPSRAFMNSRYPWIRGGSLRLVLAYFARSLMFLVRFGRHGLVMWARASRTRRARR